MMWNNSQEPCTSTSLRQTRRTSMDDVWLQSPPPIKLDVSQHLTANYLVNTTDGARPFEVQPQRPTAAPVIDVCIDFENLYLGLEQEGLTTDLEEIIAAIQLLVSDPGSQVTLVAYADWYALFKRASFDIQCALQRLGVEICNVVSQRGKNSSDMKIVDDVRTIIEQDALSLAPRHKIVLVTGDSDFCTIMDTCRRRGYVTLIISLNSCLSCALAQAADEVRYLEDVLAPQAYDATNQITGIPAYAGVVMYVVYQLQQRHWKWIYADKLALSQMEDELLREAIVAGIFNRSEQLAFEASRPPRLTATITPNKSHPLIKAIYYLLEWLPTRIAYCLNEKHMPYVDTNFLARGMTLDYHFRQLGVGQNRHDAEEWLDAAASAGIVAKKRQPHPNSPIKIIDTWWPLEEQDTLSAIHGTRLQQTCPAKMTQETHGFDVLESSKIMNRTTELT